MDVDEAARLVKGMSGEFRMPSLLKSLDDETKTEIYLLCSEI